MSKSNIVLTIAVMMIGISVIMTGVVNLIQSGHIERLDHRVQVLEEKL